MTVVCDKVEEIALSVSAHYEKQIFRVFQKSQNLQIFFQIRVEKKRL